MNKLRDEFSKIPGKTHGNDTGDIADDSYHHVEEDIKLLKDLGINSYRFSISWSRILPDGHDGYINPLGIAYYNKVIDSLIASNIEPLVTLYHWDLPLSLQHEYGGWLNGTLVERDFVNYANICFQQFGDRVKLWATFNEPWTFSLMGYGKGIFAPGRCSDRLNCKQGNSDTEVYIVGHNVLNCHAAVVELYRKTYKPIQKGRITIVLNLDWSEPLTDNLDDIEAATRKNEFALAWFADPIHFGRYPESMEKYAGDLLPKFTDYQRNLLIGSIDFFAINHYSTKYVKYKPIINVTLSSNGLGYSDALQSEESKYDSQGKLIGPQGDSAWLHIVPWGIYKVLHWINKRYTINDNKPEIIVTENGFDVPNESKVPLPEVLNDDMRIDYYTKYLASITQAISDGINIKGT